jgi:eukaryotic-like serine/threonine-protein kinase
MSKSAGSNWIGSLTFLAIVAAQLLTATCFGQAVIEVSKSADTSTTKTNWLQFGFTAAGSRYNIFENILSPSNVSGLTQNFSFKAGGYASPPVVAAGRVFFNSDDGYVYALNAATGGLLWKSGLGVTSSQPLPVAGNGMVYVWGNFYLSALDARTGLTVWTNYLGAQASSIVEYDGYLYVTAYAVAGYDLFKFSSTGTLIYETFYFATPSFSPAAIANGEIYVGASDGGSTFDLLAIPVNGGPSVWQYPISVENNSPAVVNGVVYAGSSDSNVYALNAATGSLLWKYTAGGSIFNTPAVALGAVYIGDDVDLYALNAKTGALLWKTASVGSVPAAAVANGVVYVGSSNCSIYALNAKTGAILWQYATNCPRGVSSPVVVNGVLYFSSGNNLYAFGRPH